MTRQRHLVPFSLALALALVSACKPAASNADAARGHAARGVVRELKPDGATVVIRHEAISNYMEAMTMPFHVRRAQELAGVHPGDEITFRLLVTDRESWIDSVQKTGRTSREADPAPPPRHEPAAPLPARHPLLDYAFTNEFGQPVTLGQFQGSALAYTFFFTR